MEYEREVYALVINTFTSNSIYNIHGIINPWKIKEV